VCRGRRDFSVKRAEDSGGDDNPVQGRTKWVTLKADYCRRRHFFQERTMIRSTLSCLVLFVSALSASTTSLEARDMVVAYVPNWVDLQAFSATIDYSKITHINIAFENPTNEEDDLSFRKKNEILIAKAHATGVKILMSIGGGFIFVDHRRAS
jgi:GH18 family chitinase